MQTLSSYELKNLKIKKNVEFLEDTYAFLECIVKGLEILERYYSEYDQDLLVSNIRTWHEGKRSDFDQGMSLKEVELAVRTLEVAILACSVSDTHITIETVETNNI